MPGQKWSIRLLDGIEIRRPDGTTVALPTRKSAALIAVLAVADGHPVTRERLGEILWPDSGRAQRSQSLRTELAALKRAFGERGFVEVHRTACRLLTEEAQTDFPPKQQDFVRLAPEIGEPWFHELRQGHTVQLLPQEDREPDPSDLLLKLLKWSLDDQPDSTLELMRASADLTCKLLPNDLQSVCQRLEPRVSTQDRSYGWFRFFEGYAKGSLGQFPGSLGDLKFASDWAVSHRDMRLFAEALLWQTAVLIVSGRPKLAVQLAEKAAMILQTGEPGLMGRVRHSQGLALHHSGHFKEGEAALTAALESAHYQTRAPDRAQLLSHIALFRATQHRVDAAESALEEAVITSGNANQWQMKGAYHLTRAWIALGSGDREDAQGEVELLGVHAERVGNTDLTIYAEETLARLRAEERDRQQALAHMRKGMKLRKRTAMGFTKWDEARLKPVIDSIE